MLRTTLTLDTENKNLGIVMKYFLTRLTNLNCANFILTESVHFYTYIFLLQTNNCINNKIPVLEFICIKGVFSVCYCIYFFPFSYVF